MDWLRQEDEAARDYPLAQQLTATDMLIEHTAYSAEPVHISYFELNMAARFTKNGFGILEGSWGKFNCITFAFYADYRMRDPQQAALLIEIPDITPTDIIRSLPFLSYKPIYQLSAEGYLNFRAVLKFDIDTPAKHYFSAQLDEKDFSISNAAVLNLDYLKAPFIHRVFENGQPVKSIQLDKSNSLYTGLDSIANCMVHAVICTEDPSFFSHKGIDTFHFGYAIVTNIASKKFARGGSTISMQLVRNLLLNHKKNISRKLEEIILTWLFEEVVRLPKKRILEIYLNIIEWGPGIYGIGEASRFYFSKPPEKLNLAESLVLTYIIPRPKYFCDAVSSVSPQLITKLKKHIQIFSALMQKRGFATEEDIRSIDYNIQFNGRLGTLNLA